MHRLRQTRDRLGLTGRVQLDHHTFPLELFNGPHPRRDTDTVGLGQTAPDAGFRVWTAPDDLYPHTVLLAAEAVHAAKAQPLPAAEALDAALRRAFSVDSRSIAHRQVMLDVVTEVAAALAGGTVTAEAGDTSGASAVVKLDVDRLAEALDAGRHRADVMGDYAICPTETIPGSPTLRLPDGTTITNPGISVHWEGPWAAGYPVVDADDPSVYEDFLRRAASSAPDTAPGSS